MTQDPALPSTLASLSAPLDEATGNRTPTFLDATTLLVEHWKLLTFGPILVGLVALGIAFAIKPTFTARTTILPPQSQQSAGAAALATLGALSGLSAASVRTPADQYASLMLSDVVRNRVVEKLGLMEAYKADFKVDARRVLDVRVRISVGKKDGLITVEADDESPDLASAIANGFVENLKRLTAELALTEAQQRRVFFESQVKQTGERLSLAQSALQATGFSAGALRSEPKSAADNYARLRAEIMAAEVQVQTLRRSLTEAAPEVLNKLATLSELKSQLARLEANLPASTGSDYIGKYREFKYQETLYELFSRQLELARLDESKDSSLIQVVDPATPPERKSRPKKATIAVGATVATEIILLLYLLFSSAWARAKDDPNNAASLIRLRQAMRFRRPRAN